MGTLLLTQGLWGRRIPILQCLAKVMEESEVQRECGLPESLALDIGERKLVVDLLQMLAQSVQLKFIGIIHGCVSQRVVGRSGT